MSLNVFNASPAVSRKSFDIAAGAFALVAGTLNVGGDSFPLFIQTFDRVEASSGGSGRPLNVVGDSFRLSG
jgi:hypothetical protein